MEREIIRKRKMMESPEMKKFSFLAESSMEKRLSSKSLTLKKTKLVKKSRIDIMMRRKKSEIIKELRKYKDEEMKKIDSEVASMKRDLLSYMLKELEEQKKSMQRNMEKIIEEEKVKKLKVIELELSKSVEDRSVQTNTFPESVDQKYDEILAELKDVKNSSTICKNLLMKTNFGSLFTSSSSQESTDTSPRDDDIPTSRKTSRSSISLISPPVTTTTTKDNESPLHRLTQYSFGSNTRSLFPKTLHKPQNVPPHRNNNRNSGISGTVPDISACYPSYLSTKDNIPGSNNNDSPKETNVSDSKESSHSQNVTHLSNLRESVKKLPVKISCREGNLYSKNILSPSERYLTHENVTLKGNSSAFNSEISMVERETPSYDDIVILDEHNMSSGDVSMVSRSPSFQEDTALSYHDSSAPSFQENNAELSRDRITIKEEYSDSSEQSLLTPDNNFNIQNLTQHDTAAYIRNLLSSEQNNSLCNDNPNISEENTAAYIKKLLISSQLGQADVASSSYNTLPYGDATYHGKPAQLSSEDTALYIKNLLMSSQGNSTPQSSSQVGKDTTSLFSKASFLVHTASSSSVKPDLKQTFGAKKRVYPRPDSSAYNIYTYNKKLISTQEKRGMSHRSADDIKSYSVRKKRELNKRIYEKYGPLKNHKEISDMIQTDPVFLSLPAMERYGILSCLTRSVAEHLTLSKDLLEELFSREVLSISSCKGSPIKTALNPEKLILIRKIVFFAIPSHDEKALWEMIQDSIDTKCRGILRNMKKKLSKRSLIEI